MAFYLYITIILLFVILKFSIVQVEVPTVWFMLLFVPIIVKLFISMFKTYGLGKGARFVSYTIGALWLSFVVLSHGLSLMTIMEGLPFMLIPTVAYFSKRFPFIAGIFFLILGIIPFVFFSGWYNRDIYFIITMYTFIPFPILFSAAAFLIEAKVSKKEDP